ncbi:MAG: phospholipase D-like domain-containing protein [Bacteriovoracaceae bacterium]|nr:hypothetical protein [Halobacteriovoraceae bacterium]MDP7319074.1 phospholipase D-like domain-containing protein [Bacteriovoracaceae bacterium]
MIKLLTILVFFGPLYSFSGSIKDYKFYNYEVFFTNPNCPSYEYDTPQVSFDGETLYQKPENVYCKYKDAEANEEREESPHFQIKKLITNKDIKELKMAYLSFSNNDIINTLCNVSIKQNNVKLTLVLDKGNKSSSSKWEKIKKLLECKPAQKYIKAQTANFPQVFLRGQSGGIGYAHNKIIQAKYKSQPQKVTLVFSSANMSSGTTLHHENWHFLTTSQASYLAQAHECLFTGMIDHAKTIRANSRLNREGMSAKENFVSFMDRCRKKIKVDEEDDIKAFFVPSKENEEENKIKSKAMENIISHIQDSKKISVAVHRFSQKDLIKALQRAGKSKEQEVRFVADDDIFWAGKINENSHGRIRCFGGRNSTPRVGANMCPEYFHILKLKGSDVKIRYMQTNHSSFLLHHNKYILFEKEDGKMALHCGAGNFTEAAFSDNFENYYFITIPEVLEKFKKQYEYMWTKLATPEGKLPSKLTRP